MRNSSFIVVTSINKYTDAVRRFSRFHGWRLLFVCDKKTPEVKQETGITPISLEEQENSGLKITKSLPFNHYCRKNLGYLWAIRHGAQLVLDTDDDNFPLDHAQETWKTLIGGNIEVRWVESDLPRPRSVNIYLHFTGRFVWPRGLPLDSARSAGTVSIGTLAVDEVAVWQGLVDRDPDVDAIFRLLYGTDEDFKFSRRSAAVLKAGTYCPFNSQNTLWTRTAFPLLYLPISVSFRFTDILRGYVAQRCLWAMGKHLGFVSSTAYQDRNVHSLLKDFEDEVPCYLATPVVLETLEAIELGGDPFDDIVHCYRALSEGNLVGPEEVKSVQAWVHDLRQISRSED